MKPLAEILENKLPNYSITITFIQTKFAVMSDYISLLVQPFSICQWNVCSSGTSTTDLISINIPPMGLIHLKLYLGRILASNVFAWLRKDRDVHTVGNNVSRACDCVCFHPSSVCTPNSTFTIIMFARPSKNTIVIINLNDDGFSARLQQLYGGLV